MVSKGNMWVNTSGVRAPAKLPTLQSISPSTLPPPHYLPRSPGDPDGDSGSPHAPAERELSPQAPL